LLFNTRKPYQPAVLMKTTEIAAIGKHLLSELPGFAVKGQLLLMRPLGHTLRGIFFDRSVNPRGFYVQVFIQPLFVPAEHFSFNVGWRLGGGAYTWDADAAGVISELVAEVKREALPFLSSVQSPRDVASAAASLLKSGDVYVQQAIAYAFARAGDVQHAVTALAQLERMLDAKEQYPWQTEMERKAKTLKLELRENSAVVLRQLESWEAETIKELALKEFC
jgi:hypothetical protein